MKRYVTIAVMFLFGIGYVFGFNAFDEAKAGKKEASEPQVNSEKQDAYEITGPKTVNVYLQRTYLDGKTTVDVKPVTILSMEDFWLTYSDWQMVDQNKNKVVFKKKINDISPSLKASGYFGISEDDTLTIYKGKSNEKEAIQSFFQIDVKKLESDLYQQLQEGIPVESRRHYQTVLKQFKQYSPKKQ